MAVKNVEIKFNNLILKFNNFIYRQIDGVAIGSPYGPVLENIFVGYFEFILFKNI